MNSTGNFSFFKNQFYFLTFLREFDQIFIGFYFLAWIRFPNTDHLFPLFHLFYTGTGTAPHLIPLFLELFSVFRSLMKAHLQKI